MEGRALTFPRVNQTLKSVISAEQLKRAITYIMKRLGQLPL
jgi:hypothetical protein